MLTPDFSLTLRSGTLEPLYSFATSSSGQLLLNPKPLHSTCSERDAKDLPFLKVLNEGTRRGTMP